MKKQIGSLLAAASLLTSFSVQAGLVSHSGYTLNEETHIIDGPLNPEKKNHLQWLQWDETEAASVDDFLNNRLSYKLSQGWRLATDNEMARLFNDFFPFVAWDADENSKQSGKTVWNAPTEPQNDFIELFGLTKNQKPCTFSRTEDCFLDIDPSLRTMAWYGNDADGDGFYNRANVVTGSMYINANGNGPNGKKGTVALLDDQWLADMTNNHRGLALVREVPAPASVALLFMGLIGLVFNQRRRVNNAE